jgi:hypothetical protein
MESLRFGCGYSLWGVALPFVLGFGLSQFIADQELAIPIGLLVTGGILFAGTVGASRWIRAHWGHELLDAFRRNRRPGFSRGRFLAAVFTLRIAGLIIMAAVLAGALITLLN